MIDWTKPIETAGGIPLRILSGPDSDGDYTVINEDNSGKGFVVNDKGQRWRYNMGNTYGEDSIIRNRVEVEADPVGEAVKLLEEQGYTVTAPKPTQAQREGLAKIMDAMEFPLNGDAMRRGKKDYLIDTIEAAIKENYS